MLGTRCLPASLPAYIGLFLCSSLAGCGAIPDLTESTTVEQTLPKTFAFGRQDEARSPRSQSAQPEQDLGTPAFWASFGAPELADLIVRADARNQTIAVAVARFRQARAQVEQAYAGEFPSGGVAFQKTLARPSGSSAGINQVLPVQASYQAGLNASYQIDFWGKAAATYAAAEHQSEASAFDLKAARLSIAVSVANTLFQIVSLRDQIQSAQQNVLLARKVEDNLKRLVDAGSATEIDLAQQETVLAQQQGSIPTLRRNLERAEISLAVLLGEVPGSVRVKTASLGRLRLPVVARGMPAELLRRRPDLMAAEERLLASAANVTVARAAMLPNFTLTGQAGYQSPFLKTLFSPSSAVYQLVEGVTVPLFDQPRLAAELSQAGAARDELIATYRQALLTSLSDVETSLVALRTTAEEEAIAGTAVASSRRAYDLSREQLAAGAVDITTMLATQRDYFSALQNQQAIRLSRFQATMSLYSAIGGGWSPADRARPLGVRIVDLPPADQTASSVPPQTKMTESCARQTAC